MKYFLLAQILGVLCSGTLYSCPGSSTSIECGRCQSFDDPHITTFDGVNYDQHSDDCFKYVTKCKNAPNSFPVEICGCHEDCGSNIPGPPRCIGDITISFSDTAGTETFNIFIDSQNAANPAVNTLTSTPLTSGSSYPFASASETFQYTQTGNLHTFKINGATPSPFYGYVTYQPGNLEIYLDETYFQHKTCGLCGLFNQNIGDDFTGSDGIQYVPAPIVATLTYSPPTTVVNQINNFADTYLCDDQRENDCFESAKVCCEYLWNQLVSQTPWTNRIISDEDFKDKWLYGCVIDSCSLSNNGITQNCNLQDDIYQFARQIYMETATKTYE